MASQPRHTPSWVHALLPWLIGAGVGPALVAVPVNWAADALAGAAQRWFRRLRRTDDLSRLVRAATGSSVELSRDEFDAVRRLLETRKTWVLLGHGTVEDLVTEIASSLRAQGDLTAEQLNAAGLIITRGLLEFAVADLEPELFQQVLLARLHRMETDQASALDDALLSVQADIVSRLEDQGDLQAQRFAVLMGHLKRVLDQLPPGRAHRGEIAVYLTTLIDWLSADPWPRDRRFGGPVLTSDAIERRLRVTATGRVRERDLSADDLAHRCQRLVILGGPGSGKTWLAKRTARRCAEAALAALAAGATLGEIELPLYTTCPRLFLAGGDVREATVSSALDHLGDLGGSRISAALRAFFTDRAAPTLLVVDSLDEAHGDSQRLRQADTLPWRIVLTSRPSSWNNQIIIEEKNDSHRVCELQPLHYSDDVEAFIHQWFADQPGRGHDLAAQIRRHPSLQRAATVPLILAFYCVVSGNVPLPVYRYDLNCLVLNRLLTGGWREGYALEPQVDLDSCLRVLRALAWSRAASHAVSGVGTWAEDIATRHIRLNRANQEAIDHVVTPLGPANVDTRQTLRRFIHRSIREHLVAEQVAALPIAEATDVLLPHMWFDQDWEYTAPSAIAMHPEHDQLLRNLICQAAMTDRIPVDLSAIDAGKEIRGLLCKVAAESKEGDWSPDMAAMIGLARADQAKSGQLNELGSADQWPTSSYLVREALFGRLAASRYPDSETARLVTAITQLTVTAADKKQAREGLLTLLTDGRHDMVAADLAAGLSQLGATPVIRRRARQALLKALADRALWGWEAAELAAGITQLGPTAEERHQASDALLWQLTGGTDFDGRMAYPRVVDQVILLARNADDKRRAREALLRLLADTGDDSLGGHIASGVARLAATATDKRTARDAMLAMLGEPRRPFIQVLADGVVQLAVTGEDRRQARQVLLGMLGNTATDEVAVGLVRVLHQLAPTSTDKHQAHKMLLGRLADRRQGAPKELVAMTAQFAVTTRDKRETCTVLLRLLDDRTDDWITIRLAETIGQLNPSPAGLRRARAALLSRLNDHPNTLSIERLAETVVQLGPTSADKAQVRAVLLSLLTGDTGFARQGKEANYWRDERLALAIARLDPSRRDRHRTRAALIGRLSPDIRDELPVETYPLPADIRYKLAARMTYEPAKALLSVVPQLAVTAAERRLTREMLLTLLAENGHNVLAELFLSAVTRLAATAGELDLIREVLLASHSDHEVAIHLAKTIARLNPSRADKHRVCVDLLRRLDGHTKGPTATQLVAEMIKLDPTSAHKRQARTMLISQLPKQKDPQDVERMLDAVAQLDPTADNVRQIRAAMLSLLATDTNGWNAAYLANNAASRYLAEEDIPKARAALLELLGRKIEAQVAHLLIKNLARLNPDVHDLRGMSNWSAAPSAELLTVARRNSSLTAWLSNLPPLSVRTTGIV